MMFEASFSNIAVSFIGGGNWSTRRKPAASHWQTLSHNVVSSVSTHRYNYSERVVRYCCVGRVNYTNCSYNYA